MMRRVPLIWIAATLAGIAGFWGLFIALPRWYASPSESPLSSVLPGLGSSPEGLSRRIRATLFYVAPDGLRLTGVEREIPFAERPADQARRIIEVQLETMADQVSAVPAGTKLRSLFLTPSGEAYVDLTGDVAAKHPGGSLQELLTVYAVVNALTVNLPAVSRVQILVDGKEVDTLVGHVDLRNPLQKNLAAVQPATE
jgi:hypothetical protein